VRPGLRWALRVVAGLLLVPAVLVTLARVVEPPWTLALQLEAFTPLAIVPYAAALLLLAGLVALRPDGGRRTPATAALGLVALALSLHVWWFAPLVTGSAPAAADRGPTVLTANILKGRGDVDALVTEVREREVDLLVVNEVTPRSLARLEGDGLSDVLPHRAGRPDPARGTRGTMVFAREPVRVVDRVATELDSLVVSVGDLTVLAVHPLPPLEAGGWLAEHDALLAATREHRPDLVVGDFNATLDHAPLRAYGDLGYRDAVELTNGGFAPTWPTMRGPGLIGLAGAFGPVAQIDHVLVDERWTVTEAATGELAGTDHRYVAATVAPRRSAHS
jgi:endonuclease/exonuclease/phosphatase (EEP) superfamily protein YafD